jgi:hypothetical protein
MVVLILFIDGFDGFGDFVFDQDVEADGGLIEEEGLGVIEQGPSQIRSHPLTKRKRFDSGTSKKASIPKFR